ncbi:MAG TPA: aminotransferase class I/II-fold pyridoxal phosphate-dependent enzyme [Vicinamibacterales bacterium]|nr:aminotransferase class I/II-fold pyridoxal phosphate-dependent enzyme [Acidobacteriota bacterium]HOC19237.1 aminotransferase class I/II-fold pyridoxal phosphate-dependent enzyme [Vicinamibacterales bacterium]
MADLLDKLHDRLSQAAALDAGVARPLETVFQRMLGPTVAEIDGRRTLVFGSNNYFGLTFHPEVIAAARDALDRYGSGTTGSRAANGTLAAHRELEEDLARAFGRRHALVFTTGYQANLGMVSGLCAAGDFVLLDNDCHASLYDAARLSGATILGFRHNSAESLRQRLRRLPQDGKNRLAVVEGLYSIQGDIAPLRELVDVSREEGAYLMVDEAHSIGAYGERGRGCVEAQGVADEVDFVVGTFSKALGGVGGFALSDHDALQGIPLLARPYVFTASGGAANIAGVRAALRVLMTDRTLAPKLWRAVHRLREGLSALGYRLGPSVSPIVPVTIGDFALTLRAWRALLASGLYVNLILPPACPPDSCLLRFSCSAAHTDAEVDEALELLGRMGRELGILQGT